jgi:hypothetical protein
MRTRTAIIGAALAALTLGTPALALENPLVADISPIGAGGAHGKVTLFQLGHDVNVDVILASDRSGSQGLDIRKGTCKSYAETARWPLNPVSGTDQPTRLNAKLEEFVGNALLVHKTADTSSPVVGCADLRG